MIKRENQKFYINIIIFRRTLSAQVCNAYYVEYSSMVIYLTLKSHAKLCLSFSSSSSLWFEICVLCVRLFSLLLLQFGLCMLHGWKRISFHTRYFISIWFSVFFLGVSRKNECVVCVCVAFFLCQVDTCSNKSDSILVRFTIKDSDGIDLSP